MKRPILFFWFILFFLYSCQSKKGDSSFLPLTELQPLTLGMMPTLDGLPFHIAKTPVSYTHLYNVRSSSLPTLHTPAKRKG